MDPNKAHISAIPLIVEERRQQTEVNHRCAAVDDSHVWGQLRRASAAYALGMESLWPWAPETFKLSADPIKNYVKAAALLVAKMEKRHAYAQATSRTYATIGAGASGKSYIPPLPRPTGKVLE